MTVELGGFGELRPGRGASERQIAVLVDGREDWTGQRALSYNTRSCRLLAQKRPPPPYRLDDQTSKPSKRAAPGGCGRTAAAAGSDAHYRDPVSGSYGGEWLLTMRPVLSRQAGHRLAVLVQERLTDITQPITALGHSLLRIGMVGLLLMAVVWLLCGGE